MNTIQLFEELYYKEEELNTQAPPSYCCLSTVGLDAYPNSRFVALKAIVNGSFVITGTLNSRKGKELEKNSKAALSFWWTATQVQIRIQGDVLEIPKTEAEAYFELRSRDAKIVSSIFEQGKPIQSIVHLKKHFEERKKELVNTDIACPENWGGIAVRPSRIEFMKFKKNRLHERMLHYKKEDHWVKVILQP